MTSRILVTRPSSQNQSLIEAIEQQGDDAIVYPLMTIVPVSTEDEHGHARIRQKIQKLDKYQHLICISTNAAQLAWDWVDQYWPQTPDANWYAIGLATANIISQHTDVIASGERSMNSEALLALPELQNIQDHNILIFRGKGGREHLKQSLENRGAFVDYCELYERLQCEQVDGRLKEYFEQGLDILTVTSSETIKMLLDQAVYDGINEEVKQLPIIAPGKRNCEFAKSLGFQQIFEAENAGLQAMLDAINRITKQ